MDTKSFGMSGGVVGVLAIGLSALILAGTAYAASTRDQANTADLTPTADVGESGVLGSIRGQTFTGGLGGRLTSIEFFMANRWGSPDTDPVLVRLMAGEVASTEQAIASTSIPFAIVPVGTPGWVVADFSNANVVVQPGEVYTVSLSSNAAYLNHATLYANTNSYTRGQAYFFGTLCCSNPDYDLGFRTYVEPVQLAAGIHALGTLPGHDRSNAIEVSADGSLVAGYSYLGSRVEGFHWSPGGALQSMTLPGDARSSAMPHPSGIVVTGQSCAADHDPCHGVVWNATRGLESLTLPGDLDSGNGAVSEDGSTVIGYSRAVGNVIRGVRWTTNGGLTALGNPPGLPRAVGYALSADGSAVVGAATDNTYIGKAFRWTPTGGFTLIDPLPGDQGSSADYVSPDGGLVSGYSSYAAGSAYSGYQRAFIWTEGTGLQPLVLPGDHRSNREAVSADGSTIVGHSCIDDDRCRAFAWTLAGGVVELPAPVGVTRNFAGKISADGRVIAGTGCTAGDCVSGLRGWVWTAELGTMEIEPLPGDATTQVLGMSTDGSAVWARSCVPDQSSCRALLWTHPGVKTTLLLPGYVESYVSASSIDGAVVAGESCDATYMHCEAFAWSVADGLQSLTPPGFTTSFASGQKSMSPDGAVIVGGACDDDYLVCAPIAWSRSGGLEVLSLLPGDTSGWANAVAADASLIVGESFAPDGFFSQAVVWAAGSDNCPLIDNPDQSDIDDDGAGDVCDICPADAQDTCDTAGSTAQEVVAGEPASITTPDGGVAMVIEPGDVTSSTTISVTQASDVNPDVNVGVGTSSDLGEAVAVYEFGPDGLQFASPITVTMRADVTPLDPAQRAELGVYLFTDTDNDDVEDSYVRQDGSCTVVESPPGTFTATCVVELAHFSVYSIIAPRDSDGDGVPDDFAGRVDSCRLQDATGFDVDENGCIDSFSGLAGLVGTLVSEGVIDAQMANSLLMKVNNAAASATVDNVCAAIQQLLALEAQVRALTGKKISAAAATRVLRYADSVIAAQRSGLPAGSNCG